jgi:hypothetical protein
VRLAYGPGGLEIDNLITNYSMVIVWHPEYYTFVDNAKQQAGHKDHYWFGGHFLEYALISMKLYRVSVVHMAYGKVSRLFVGERKL